MANVILKPRRAKPFLLRHPWVFSGAVARVEGDAEKGGVVSVRDERGRFIGQGYYNPDSQIVVRMASWDEAETLDDDLLRRRIEAAVRLRHETLGLGDPDDACRLVFSDSDLLPGLIVDRFANVLSVQFLTAAMALRKEVILGILGELLSPSGIHEAADEDAARKEGIVAERTVLRGAVPEEPIEVRQGKLRFLIDVHGGQKTGFYLDQRDNRAAAARYMAGRSVLDAFCYTGGFSVAAAVLGKAESVFALDRSEPALDLAKRNFALNGIENVETLLGQTSVELRNLKAKCRTFGAVILDPPKFARSRPGVARALRAYRDANLLAMQLLEPEGILVTCSCSGHVGGGEFLGMLNDAAREAGVLLQVLERRGQSADHPVIASCPETAYLKCFICRVVK